MKFKKQYLTEELDLPYEAIRDKIEEQNRWSTLHEIVFKDKDNKYYETGYSVGSTEQQDERPWEDQEYVECVEVELKEITIKEWVPVEKTKEK